MKLTVGGVVYAVDLDRLENTELIAVEDATNLTLQEWQAGLNRGSMKAFTALVWLLRRRDEPGLEFTDVRFEVNTLEVDESEDLGKSSADDTAPTSATS